MNAIPVEIQKVSDYYIANGWETLVLQQTYCDLIAKKGTKIHFVKAITDDNIDKYLLTKNVFVQNAFSNNATPVYAKVGAKSITTTDVNSDSRVIIKSRKKTQTPTITPTKVSSKTPATKKAPAKSSRKTKTK